MRRSMIFALTSATAAATAAYAVPPAANTSQKAVDPRDQIVCRSHLETGSLAHVIRTCKTRREWDDEAANIRASAGSSINSCRQSGQTGQC
jgi:hypothetical protein